MLINLINKIVIIKYKTCFEYRTQRLNVKKNVKICQISTMNVVVNKY